MEQEKIWCALKPTLFIDIVDDQLLSIYDTDTSTFMESTDREFISVIGDFISVHGRGCIEYSQDLLSMDFKKARALGYISTIKSKNRPLNLLPILNLQCDVEKGGNLSERISLLGSKLAQISGLKIELSSMLGDTNCQGNSRDLCEALDQYCIFSHAAKCKQLEVAQLNPLLKQLPITSIAILDLYCSKKEFISSQNIQILTQLVPDYMRINIHMMADDYCETKSMVEAVLSADKRLQLHLYADKRTGDRILKECKSPKFKLHYFVYSQEDMEYAEKLEGLIVCPVVLKDNIKWITGSLSLKKEEIQTQSYSFNHLFRNMKLNANFFGILDITRNGEIKAHGSCIVLGRIADGNFALIDSISEEFKNNTSWRTTRNQYKKCAKCSLRYMCPPISIFELNGKLDTICI